MWLRTKKKGGWWHPAGFDSGSHDPLPPLLCYPPVINFSILTCLGIRDLFSSFCHFSSLFLLRILMSFLPFFWIDWFTRYLHFCLLWVYTFPVHGMCAILSFYTHALFLPPRSADLSSNFSPEAGLCNIAFITWATKELKKNSGGEEPTRRASVMYRTISKGLLLQIMV